MIRIIKNAINNSLEFKLFPSCIPVKGSYKSIIIDLNRNCFYVIPNTLYDLLLNFNNHSISEVYAKHSSSKKVLNEYFSFLLEKELITFTEGIYLAPINNKFETPKEIENSIIDLEQDSLLRFDYKEVFKSLDNLRCHSIQFRFYYKPTVENLNTLFDGLNGSVIRSIELLLPFSNTLYKRRKEIAKLNPRLTNVLFYNSPEFKIEQYGTLIISKVIDDFPTKKCCGTFSPNFFSIGVDSYNEALKYNTCLNKKISVDADGKIKNCPSFNQYYGNINETKIEDVLIKQSFKKLWNINKDNIKICKDCEYRYICTDCRAYISDPKNIYSKPLKCGYDPYTGKWSEWSTNPLNKKAINYYDLEGFL